MKKIYCNKHYQFYEEASGCDCCIATVAVPVINSYTSFGPSIKERYIYVDAPNNHLLDDMYHKTRELQLQTFGQYYDVYALVGSKAFTLLRSDSYFHIKFMAGSIDPDLGYVGFIEYSPKTLFIFSDYHMKNSFVPADHIYFTSWGIDVHDMKPDLV